MLTPDHGIQEGEQEILVALLAEEVFETEVGEGIDICGDFIRYDECYLLLSDKDSEDFRYLQIIDVFISDLFQISNYQGCNV